MVTGKLGRLIAGWLSHGRNLERLSYEFRPKNLRFTFNLWMALGGMVVPQPAATSDHPGLFRPGLFRNAAGKLAPTKLKRNRLGDKA